MARPKRTPPFSRATIGALPIGGVTVRVESPERKGGFAYAMDFLGNELRMTPATEAKVSLRSWIAAEENLVTVEVRSADAAPVTLKVETFADNHAKDYPAWASVAEGDIAQAVRQTRDTPGMKWVSRGALSTRVIGAAVTTRACAEGKVTQTVVLPPGATAHIVTCVSGGGRTGYAHTAQAALRLRALDTQAVARLEAAKAAWWGEM